MNKERIVVLDTGYESYDQEQALFEQAGYHLDVYRGPARNAKSKLLFGRGAVGVMIRGTAADESFFSALPGLKALVRYGVGYDNVDLTAATRHGVRVANVQGYANESVSDHALALMFACNRAFPWVKNGRGFGKPPAMPIPDFSRSTLGIIGLGRIGSRLAEKACSLFERMVAYDPYVEECRFFRLACCKVSLPELLQQSHVISVHCNLTTETRGMIGAAQFTQMEQKPVLINTARGPVVDEKALLKALDQERVRWAGVDVYDHEPPRGVSLKVAGHAHVLATGHYAWYSENAKQELQRRAAENMLTLLSGGIPEDCLNPFSAN